MFRYPLGNMIAPGSGDSLTPAPEILLHKKYRPFVADTYSFAWMHYDIINPKLKLTNPSRRQSLVDATRRNSPPNDLDLASDLRKAMRDMGMTARNSPGAFKEADIIAQGLQPDAKRVSFHEYYKAWCKAKSMVCQDAGNGAWQAEGNNQGIKAR